MRTTIISVIFILVSLVITAQNQKAVIYLKDHSKVETLSNLVDSLSFLEQKGVLKTRAVILNQANKNNTLYAVRNVDSIRVLNPSDKVITHSISDLTSNAVTCKGIVTINDGSLILERGFVWGTSTNPTYENNLGKTVNGNQSGEYSATINGLTSGIKYYVRAYVLTNSTTYYGDEISFNPGTLPTLTTNALTGICSTTAVGGATIDNGGSPITASGLVWSKSQNPTVFSNEGMTINGPGSATTVDYLSNLTPLSNYYVRAYASNYFGTNYGNTVTFTTNSNPDITNNISTKADMKAQYDNMYYQLTQNAGTEAWTADALILSDTHSDNSYHGSTGIELTQLEQHNQNRYNENINRDWVYFYNLISTTNKVICNIDLVQDPTLTLAERKQWKSEALIMRSMIYFDMVRLWGAVPLVTTEIPAVVLANLTSVNYHLYLPKRDSVLTVYRQLIKDLNVALETGGAPGIDPANKFKFSRTVANALLAKIYAEKPVRDYDKVIYYSNEVEKDVTLVPNYGDLFDMNATNTDVKNRNTSESIFEINFSGGGLWFTWLVGIDQSDPNSKYDWVKWCTPSRDLIAAFDKAGDVIRKAETIINADVTWSDEYPSKGYPFMYKYRSKFHSVIKVRLADILLLKAEAFLGKGDVTNATTLVNKVRTRAKLANLSSVTIDDVLNERRLELAFEGQRWFDLVRNDKVSTVMNTLNYRDVGRLPIYPITENKLILPIPQFQIDQNPLLVQNPGYDGKPLYPKSVPGFDVANVTQTVINFGDPIDLHVTVSDPVTPLLAVKVNIIINNTTVSSETVITSGNQSDFNRTYRIPLVKQANDNTDIKISLTSTNIAGYSKDTVISTTKANRPSMPDLYLVLDGASIGKKLTLTDAANYIYSISGLTSGTSISYKLATKVKTAFKKVDWSGLVFGKVGDGIGIIDSTGLSITSSDASLIGITEFSFDAYNFTAKVGGNKLQAVKTLDVTTDLVANPTSLVNNTGFRGASIYFGEGVEITFTGITNLANNLSPDYFQVTGTNTAKFLGKTGLYKAYYLTTAGYLYVEPLPDAIYPDALWICGTGLGRPQTPLAITSSWNWNNPLDYAPCRLVSPGVYQVTVYCKNDAISDVLGTLNFKFFHKRGWWDGHEELSTNYTVSSPFNSTSVVGNSGNVVGLSTLPFEGVYRITLNQNDMTIKAEKLN
ncbi:MAG: RagB/SusD family nutrient uptake outer membrane protein [Paludibacter sp.]|nr:RagB/SusD family nutrient uptake outer membrane protein [Paludibacter sp.]